MSLRKVALVTQCHWVGFGHPMSHHAMALVTQWHCTMGFGHPVSLGWLWSPNVTALSGCAQAVSQQGCPWSNSRSTEQLWSPNVTARNGPAHPMALRKVALVTQWHCVRWLCSRSAAQCAVPAVSQRGRSRSGSGSTEQLRPPAVTARSGFGRPTPHLAVTARGGSVSPRGPFAAPLTAVPTRGFPARSPLSPRGAALPAL